jgi:hypothetical protein
MSWWKLALIFVAGFVAGALAWAVGDLAVLDMRGDYDLTAEDMDSTELYDDEPVKPLPFAEMTSEERDRFFPIWGKAFFGVENFKLNDQQGRTVLKVKSLRGNFNLNKLRTGVYRGSVRRAEQIDLWLYRAPSGEVSLAEAFGTAPQPVKQDLGLEVPLGDWTLEVGPVKVGRTRLHIMLTDTPIVIELEDATVFARQKPGEKAPKIFIQEASAKMIEPQPLPNPVPIPYATAVVALSGKPLVDLTAVACVNREPLKVRVVVPTKISRVFITADAGSVSGGLGIMGLKIAGEIEDELEVKSGPVQVRGEYDCSGRRVVKIDADGNIIEE